MNNIRANKRNIYIDYMNICKLIWHHTNRHINKDRSKATYYAFFIIKGNHIAWDFKGQGIQRQAVVL